MEEEQTVAALVALAVEEVGWGLEQGLAILDDLGYWMAAILVAHWDALSLLVAVVVVVVAVVE